MKALGFSLGALGALALAGVAHARSHDAVVARNIFCSGCKEHGPPPEGVRTKLPLELVATLRCPTDERWSVAVIVQTQSHTSGLYPRGARVAGAEVVAIGARRVTLRVGDHLETLALDGAPTIEPVVTQAPPSTGIACAGSHCDVDAALVKKILQQPGQIGGWVRAAPSPAGGLALQAVRPDSPIARLGLKPGDRIRAINRVPLEGIEQMLHLYTELKNATQLSIELDRGGRLQTLDYTIR
jgi:general secretion pathway protein C